MIQIGTRFVGPEWPGGHEGKCRIVIVGEAPGAEEALAGKPFVGRSGKLITKTLEDVGIDRSNCLVTNVFHFKPLENDVTHFFIKKSIAKKEGKTGDLPPFGTAGYVNPQYRNHLTRLWREIEIADPNIIIALGATALWALTGLDKIGINRGTVLETACPGQSRPRKVVASYHPAAVMRAYHNLPLLAADLLKAKKEAGFPELRRIVREIWIAPTLADLHKFYVEHIAPLRNTNTPLAADVETGGPLEQITCVGFSPSPLVSLVIPFYDSTAPAGSYWPTVDDELRVMEFVAGILEDPTITKLFQNVTYDASWFYSYGIKIRGIIEDTMHMHHALQPELPKGLGILGSMFANELVWKTLVKHKENKRDS